MNFGLLDCRRGKTNACTQILLESLHLEDVWRPELFGNLFVSFISPATSDFYPQKHHPPKQTWSGVMRRHVIFRVDVRCWRGWRIGLPWGTNQVAAQMMSHNHPNMKLPKKNGPTYGTPNMLSASFRFHWPVFFFKMERGCLLGPCYF